MDEIRAAFRRFLKTFRIKREERIPAAVVLVFFLALNLLMANRYFWFVTEVGNGGSWKQFSREFVVSGFDPITYMAITDWETIYNVFRHPLLAFFIYPLYLLNNGLLMLTGMNLAQFVVMLPLLFCACYSYVFIYRIMREIIVLRRADSILLSAMTFSIAYIMIAFAVPDHFGPSMLMIVMCLYVCGKCMQKRRRLNIWQTWLLFIFTAGITLSNGIKIFLDTLFVNGRSFFRLKYFLLAVIMPSALIWILARWETDSIAVPREKERQEARVEAGKRDSLWRLAKFRDTTSISDSSRQMASFEQMMEKRRKNLQYWRRKSYAVTHRGKPVSEGEFSSWTDVSTPRWESVVENVFGESVQFHQSSLLQDVLRTRPVIVAYDWVANYVVEALIVLLMICGLCLGLSHRFYLMCLAGVAFDMFIHIVLGFGLNEVYIMAAHWAFIIPISIAYLMSRLSGKWLIAVRGLSATLTLWLLTYNTYLLIKYFTQ